jgi:hypothetical protein
LAAQAALKHYQDGTRIGDDVMGGANPLLLVHGSLTEEGARNTPHPPQPQPGSPSGGDSKRGRRPNVIEAIHMVQTGRVDTAPFMRA